MRLAPLVSGASLVVVVVGEATTREVEVESSEEVVELVAAGMHARAAIARELLLLEAGGAGSLDQRERLVSLHLATNLLGQARDEVGQEKGWRQSDYPVGQVFELRQVLYNCPSLCEYKQGKPCL